MTDCKVEVPSPRQDRMWAAGFTVQAEAPIPVHALELLRVKSRGSNMQQNSFFPKQVESQSLRPSPERCYILLIHLLHSQWVSMYDQSRVSLQFYKNIAWGGAQTSQ